MLRRITIQQALLRLQDISADCSDGEYSDSELDDALTNDAQTELNSRREDQTSIVLTNNDSNLQNQVQANQDLIKKDEITWQTLAIFHVQRGRLQQPNILSFKPGPTAFATSRITENSPLSSFCVLFDEAMLRNIRKCTVAKALANSYKLKYDT